MYGSAIDAANAASGFRLIVGSKEHGTEMCTLPGGASGRLEPCSAPAAPGQVVFGLSLYPLHSDVDWRGSVHFDSGLLSFLSRGARGNQIREQAALGDNGSGTARISSQAGTDMGSGKGTGSGSGNLGASRLHSDFGTSAAWTIRNLNALQDSITRTQLNNLHSIPQDCPHREKRGWGGDAQVTSAEASLNFDMGAFYGNWLRTMHDIQIEGCTLPPATPAPGGYSCWTPGQRVPTKHAFNFTAGSLPFFMPRGGDFPGGAPTWTTVGIVAPWEWGRYSGDASIAQAGLTVAEGLIDFWSHYLDVSTGLLNIGLFGDWSPRTDAIPKLQNTPVLMSSHFTWVEALGAAAQLAKVSGNIALQHKWAAMAANASVATHARWWNQSMGCYGSDCSL